MAKSSSVHFADIPWDEKRKISIERGQTVKMADGFDWPFNFPNAQDFKPEYLEDLAHIGRWNGKVRYHYSVMQHSLHLHSIVPAALRPYALLHDAGVLIYGEIIGPIEKWISVNNDFRVMWTGMINANDYAIYKALGLEWRLTGAKLQTFQTCHESVKQLEQKYLLRRRNKFTIQVPEIMRERNRLDLIDEYFHYLRIYFDLD